LKFKTIFNFIGFISALGALVWMILYTWNLVIYGSILSIDLNRFITIPEFILMLWAFIFLLTKLYEWIKKI